MGDDDKGAATRLDDFTNNQLIERFRKAKDFSSRLEDQSQETCSAYQLHASEEVREYLELIAQEAKLELEYRNQPNELKRLRDEFSAFKNTRSYSSYQDPKFRKAMGDFLHFTSEIKRVEAISTEVPKQLEKIRAKLAATPSQGINSYMTALGVPGDDCLRPPRSDNNSGDRELKTRLRQFETFAASWWNARPEIQSRRLNRGRDEVPETALMEFARECDKMRFNPNGTVLPRSVYGAIRKWNESKEQRHRIFKFEDLIVHFGKSARDAAIDRGEDRALTKLRDLYPLRRFLSTNATRLAKTPENHRNK